MAWDHGGDGDWPPPDDRADDLNAHPETGWLGPCGARARAATVEESQAFVEAYQRAAGRAWSTDEVEASWAAGLWVYAFNAKKASLDGASWLDPDEAAQRLRLAGA